MTAAFMHSDSEKELSWAGNWTVALTFTATSVPTADRLQEQQNYVDQI